MSDHPGVITELAGRLSRRSALRVPLCHALLSWLVGARRPAMSRAINELEQAGRLARCPDDSWWLGRQRPEGFGEPALPAQPVAA